MDELAQALTELAETVRDFGGTPTCVFFDGCMVELSCAVIKAEQTERWGRQGLLEGRWWWPAPGPREQAMQRRERNAERKRAGLMSVEQERRLHKRITRAAAAVKTGGLRDRFGVPLDPTLRDKVLGRAFGGLLNP